MIMKHKGDQASVYTKILGSGGVKSKLTLKNHASKTITNATIGHS